LALPIAVAGMGFSIAALFLIGIWVLSWVAGLLTLEVNLAFEGPRNTYATMAEATLGPLGKGVTYVLFVIFLYALTSAYISGGSSLIQAASQLLFGYSLPQWINTSLFTLVLGSIVAWSTRAVDLFNRGLFGIKTVLLLVIFIVFLPQVNISHLLAQHDWFYAGAGIPVILAAFGSHIVVPSVAQYMGRDLGKLKIIVLFGSLIPLIVYLIWTACMLGTIPYYGENSLASIASSPTQIETLMYAINATVQTPVMSLVINLFSHVVIITSFLGCALSLFDFLRDKEYAAKPPHRAVTGLLTFVPPLLVGLFYPDALVQLLSGASIVAALILIVIPALMAWRLRKMTTLSSPYRVPGGTPLILSVILIALVLIGTEIGRMTGFFATWLG